MSCFCCSRHKRKSPQIENHHPGSPNAQIMSGSVFQNGTGCDTGKINFKPLLNDLLIFYCFVLLFEGHD